MPSLADLVLGGCLAAWAPYTGKSFDQQNLALWIWCYRCVLKRIFEIQAAAGWASPRVPRTPSLMMPPFFPILPQCRICVSSCPSGHYHADKKRCRKCAPNCESCFGSHGDQCLSCKYGYFLNEEINSCVLHCPDGSYPDPSELISNIWVSERK